LLWVALPGLAGCGSGQSEFREPPPLNAQEQLAFNQKVFAEAASLVEEFFYDPALLEQQWPRLTARYRPLAVAAVDTLSFYRVLNTLFEELKVSHLNAYDPRQTFERQRQQTSATGFRTVEIDSRIVVTDVLPSSPAGEAGVQAGWIVAEINGASLPIEDEEFSLDPAQPVRYVFLGPDDRRRSLTLRPVEIDIRHVESSILDGGAVCLRFDQFDSSTVRWLGRQLAEGRDRPGLILDLRFNSGGPSDAVKDSLRLFHWDSTQDGRINAGAWVSRDGGVEPFQVVPGSSGTYEGRLVVLTGPSTRSAAEVFTRVLQYQKRALVVGQATAGAVISSRRFTLSGGGSLLIPVRDYRDPGGERLEGRGVTPDVQVIVTLEGMRHGDPEREAAIKVLAAPPGL
jgi:carboxyl-terminal processing protease